MKTTPAPNPIPQQGQTLSPASSGPWAQRMLSLAKWAGFLLLFYLIGPVILCAVTIRAEAAGPMWQAGQRWARVNGTAFPQLLWYVPIVIFHTALASFWSLFFISLAQWFHLSVLAWLGNTSMLPPLPASTLLRWVLAFPLAGLLAILLEIVQPQTIWETKRIITPEEQVQLAVRKATTRSHATPSTRRQQEPRTKVVSSDEQPSHFPKADSLWGRIDWQAIPETHPLKQAAPWNAKQREEDRDLWLTQQRAALPPTDAALSIVDSTLTSPTIPSSPASTEDDYNWDEGEGSIQA